jgi:hypothetical protein
MEQGGCEHFMPQEIASKRANASECNCGNTKSGAQTPLVLQS